MADSRDVAKGFGKRHCTLLRSIRDLACSADFRRYNYTSFEINDLTGTSTSHVMMTFKGFMMLVMGFTGGKATRLKEAWIAEFEAMQERIAELENRVVIPNFSNPADAAREWAAQYDRAQLAHTKLIEAKKAALTETQAKLIDAEDELFDAAPKVEAYEDLLDALGTYALTTAMKILGVRPRIGMKWMEGKDDPRLSDCVVLGAGNWQDRKSPGHVG